MLLAVPCHVSRRRRGPNPLHHPIAHIPILFASSIAAALHAAVMSLLHLLLLLDLLLLELLLLLEGLGFDAGELSLAANL